MAQLLKQIEGILAKLPKRLTGSLVLEIHFRDGKPKRIDKEVVKSNERVQD